MDKEVRNKYNIVIGWCRDLSSTINAQHYKKGFVGWYSKHTDITYDKRGNIYCRGDGTQSLIREADKD